MPFHGRRVRGWVLGPTEDVPQKVLQVTSPVSPIRFFDERMLELLRWVSERYVSPLAAVIARSHPPRVASEEMAGIAGGAAGSGGRFAHSARSARLIATAHLDSAGKPLLASYRGGAVLQEAIATGNGAFVLRPAPEDEVAIAVECVGAALAGGRTAIVLVPEADPVPATAAAIGAAFGDEACLWLGGDRRERYRTWLEIAAGRYSCVVGTRPAVFAPLAELGVVYVSRESHPGHREERAPYYHVRDVALVRARLGGAVCVMSALCPSLEASVSGAREVAPGERRWPPVEVVRPGPEGRAPRLVSALRGVRRAFLFEPLPGYGVARTCRSCGEPAACATCGGMLRSERGLIRCAVCGADGLCSRCGASDFGIARGGAERVEEWARRIVQVPVRRGSRGEVARPPGEREVLVGGPEAVRDFGPLGLEVVGILDADLASRRPGLSARERALAVWMEAASWARLGGRVIVQTRAPGDPAIQALVAGNPARFHRAERARRAEAGFPLGAAVFRVRGAPTVAAELRTMAPLAMLTSGAEGQTICLLALDPGRVAAFGTMMRRLAERGVVSRVEAEPHL